MEKAGVGAFAPGSILHVESRLRMELLELERRKDCKEKRKEAFRGELKSSVLWLSWLMPIYTAALITGWESKSKERVL